MSNVWKLYKLELMALAAGALLAQQPPPAALTITQAVQNALHNYPSIQVSQEQINAAAAGDRILIPAGSFTWGAGGTSVAVTKAVAA